MPSFNDSEERREWIADLNTSHENFVAGIVTGDAQLVLMAYCNYVRMLGFLLEHVQKEKTQIQGVGAGTHTK